MEVITVLLLVLTAVTQTEGNEAIFVHPSKGLLEDSCWNGGRSSSCATLELALEGARRLNSSVVLIRQRECNPHTSSEPIEGNDGPHSSGEPIEGKDGPHNSGKPIDGPHSFGEPIEGPHSFGEPIEGKDGPHSSGEPIEGKNGPHSSGDVSYDMSCHTWGVLNSTRGECECGNDLGGVVQCNYTRKEVAILDCYCMTYDNQTGKTVAGKCFYNCENIPKHTLRDPVYHRLPINISQLNDAMCGRLNRQGQLCGECKDGYYLPGYSYDMKCIKCSPSHHHGWLKYTAVALLPLSVFLLIVLCCGISATSPQLQVFVAVCQILATPANIRILSQTQHQSKSVFRLVQILATFYGIWNLDFFRTITFHICLKVTTLQALALDYVIAIYPLIVLFVTYISIELNDRNCVPIAWLWKLLRLCFSRFRRHWNIKTSVIRAFATFLLLSYERLLSVSFALLVPTGVYDDRGQRVGGLYLYYDATIEMFGEEHFPYAILALVVVVLFVLFPLLLLIMYPTQCFQKCLNRYQLRCHTLRCFIEAFQGCFKDGTDNTHDCRYVAALYLGIRIILGPVYALTLSGLFYAVGLLVFVIVAIVVAVVKPYKPKFSVYNTTDFVLFLTLALIYASIVCVCIAEDSQYSEAACMIFFVLTFLTAFLPLVAVACSYWLYSQKIRQGQLPAKILSWLSKHIRNCSGNQPEPCRSYQHRHRHRHALAPNAAENDRECLLCEEVVIKQEDHEEL